MTYRVNNCRAIYRRSDTRPMLEQHVVSLCLIRLDYDCTPHWRVFHHSNWTYSNRSSISGKNDLHGKKEWTRFSIALQSALAASCALSSAADRTLNSRFCYRCKSTWAPTICNMLAFVISCDLNHHRCCTFWRQVTPPLTIAHSTSLPPLFGTICCLRSYLFHHYSHFNNSLCLE